MMMRETMVLAAGALLVASGSAVAQTTEVSLSAGFTPTVTLERHAPEVEGVHISEGLTVGFRFGRFFGPHWGIEGAWTQQFTELELTTAEGSADLFDMTVGQLDANVVYQFGATDRNVRPFVFGGVGAAFFAARDLPTESKLGLSLGGGVKVFPSRMVGFRGHVRYKPAFLDDESSGDFCDPFGFCQGWLQQLEVLGGVVIRF